ncbi:MAG: Ig-like domain-containing protein [Solirubrobacterales bacterium]|nr:Ig-like domain-containing protein [Solirubrobacterales bacterium]
MPGDVFLVPSCTVASNSTCGTPEPVDLFSFSASGVGVGGSASCAGNVFTITTVVGDPEHRIQFTSATPVELTAAGTVGATCTIRFSATTLSLPTVDAYPDIPGLQTNAIGQVQARQTLGGSSDALPAAGNVAAPITIVEKVPRIKVPRIKPKNLRLVFSRCPDRSPAPPPFTGKAPGNRASATITGPTGCQRNPFKVRVAGDGIDSVTFRLDGRKIKVDATEPFVVRIDPRQLKSGPHVVAARVRFVQG